MLILAPICLGMDSKNCWDSTLPTHHFSLRAKKQLHILDQRKKLTEFGSAFWKGRGRLVGSPQPERGQCGEWCMWTLHDDSDNQA